MAEDAGRTEGVLESLRSLATTFIAVLQTRLELFATEIDEERERLGRLVVLAVAAVLCIGVAVNLLVFFLMVLFWDTNRLLAIGVLIGIFAAGGIGAALMLRSAIRRRPKFLSATLAELRKDRKALDGQ